MKLSFNKIFLVCIIFALFMASASFAWAGLNYESANKYFLIDTPFKSGGDLILVGNAFDDVLKKENGATSEEFFAISNNLVFSDPDASFCTIKDKGDSGCTGDRRISNNLFTTSEIQVSNPAKDFEIRPKDEGLLLESKKIRMKSDFRLDGTSLSFVEDDNYSFPHHITVNKLYANSVVSINNDIFLTIPQTLMLSITKKSGCGSDAVAAGTITYIDETTSLNEKFCKVIHWGFEDNSNYSDTTARDLVNNYPCPIAGDGGIPTGNMGPYASKACCPDDYLIFDLDVNNNKMVCCRANQFSFPSITPPS